MFLLRHAPDASITLRRSGGGVFEVVVNGALRYSKKSNGRFPTEAELLSCIA